MIDLYPPVLRAFFRMVGQRWLENIEAELWKYSQALNNWLYDLFLHPTADWRERLAAFEAEQEAEGRTLTPDSRAALVDYLEDWARGQFKPAIQLAANSLGEPATEVQKLAMAAPSAAPRVPRPTPPRKPNHFKPPREVEQRFWQKLQDAKRHLTQIETVLEQIAAKVEAAPEGEAIDIEPEGEEIESLVWKHHDAFESARGAWLEGRLRSRESINAMMQMSSPVTYWLPMFFDRDQAERARVQWKKIGERLDENIAFFDNVIFAMRALEIAGNVATLLLGVGVLYQAARQGGKVVLVKTFAKMVTGGAASTVTGDIAAAGARALGASEETITRVQGAAEIVTWLIVLRKVQKANLKELTNRSKSKNPSVRDGESRNRGDAVLPVAPAAGVQVNREIGNSVRDAIALRETPAVIEQTFRTVGGLHRVDVLKLGRIRIAIESKVGRVSLDDRIRQELARDWWLRRQGQVDLVIWEFTRSAATGAVGPTEPLRQKLTELGFQIRIN